MQSDNITYGPNLSQSGWMSGAHWAVAHRCARCHTVEFMLYESGSATESNLQCVRLPPDWYKVNSMKLCPDCYESFVNWISEGL